ncbi:hypothetical protein CUMW_087860, partial [Citrus unshiu]
QNLPSRAVHESHRPDHELHLKNYRTLFECNGCKTKGSGLMYRWYSGSPGGYNYCEACVKPTPGFVYHCEKNGCNLHPCCFNLPTKLQILDAEFELSDKKLSEKCLQCNKKRLNGSTAGIPGWSYVAACNKYNYHAYCSTNMLLEKWEKADSGNDCLVPKNVQQPICEDSSLCRSKEEESAWC